MLSQDKVDYLTRLIDETNFTVESMARASTAMGYVAKWVIGIL